MLINESIWIKATIEKNFKTMDFPLLNVGSSTEMFRKDIQPHIYNSIFKPLEEQSLPVIHSDIKIDSGVDIAGDLNDLEFQKLLREQKIRSILCSNLLEHLIEPRIICQSLLNIIEPGGLILVTVPHSFPYHKDPIDTMFRPEITELHEYFPGTQILVSDIVEDMGTYKQTLFSNKKYMAIMILRYLLPFYKYTEWKLMIKDLLKWKRKFSATCLLLQKGSSEQQVPIIKDDGKS